MEMSLDFKRIKTDRKISLNSRKSGVEIKCFLLLSLI